MKKLIILALLIFTSLAAWSAFQARHEQHATSNPQAAVNHEPNVLRYSADAPQLSFLQIGSVQAGQVPVLEPLQGHVTYDEDATSRITAPIAGRVTHIHVQVGDHVRVGQAMLALDAPDFAQARADFRHAVADAHLKRAAFDRAKTLFDHGVLAGKDFESAQADLQQAEIEVERSRSRLKNLGPDSDDGFILRTRVAGVVMDRQANPGSEVRPDAPAPLFIVSDPLRLWVNVEVAEQNLDKIRVGQHLRIESDAYPDQSFDAEVLLIGKLLDPATRRVVVRCRVDNRSESLKPEMYVRATPLGGGDIAPRVPNSALVTEGVQNFLFVEKSPGVLEKRHVSLSYRGHEESYIASGLNAGERIVMSGALLLNAEMAGN